jgi:TetR/AcrR family transcriptional regulator, transcriptional repressor for nem operon
MPTDSSRPSSQARTTRDQIVGAADRLIYEQGYDHTSFAHIAEAVGISRGNFYHHFKTKDEILEAVIDARMAGTASMLQQWEARSTSPADRIRSFIHMMVDNRADIRRFGCPVGTLCTELAKLGHPAKADANRLLALFRDWLRDQFEQLGRKADADELAMHALARSQGIATLAAAFNSDAYIGREVALMDAWLQSCIPARRGTIPRKK